MQLNDVLEMQRNDLFLIDLLDARLAEKTLNYDLGDTFFQQIGGLVDRGSVSVRVQAEQRRGGMWFFTVRSEGFLIVPCHRCLGDLKLRIDSTDTLQVRIGDNYDDDGEVITVPASEGRFDLSLPLYELIVLSLPMQWVHEPGECDPAMMRQINAHQAARSEMDTEDYAE